MNGSVRAYGQADHRKGMLVRATLAQNVGTGSAFGGLGVSILALQDRFDASLGTATMGLSLTVLTMTALGPLIAWFIARWGLRRVMSIGVLTSLFGYLALAYAPTMPLALAACGLLIGPGAALFAAVPPAVLASGWYPETRGQVMGIAYLPLLVTVIPMIGINIIQSYGLTGFYVFLSSLHLLLLPLMFGIKEPPTGVSAQQSATNQSAASSTSPILLSGAFWLTALGDGILNGSAITGSALLLPIIEDYSFSVQSGAILLTVSGASSILGSLLSGFACDRVGPARTLVAAAVGFAAAWSIIASTAWMPGLAVSAFLLGLCGAAVFPPISALSVDLFGLDALPRVLGLLGVMTLPFTFAISPVAGWLRDVTGNYDAALALLIGTCFVAAGSFALVAWRSARMERVPNSARI